MNSTFSPPESSPSRNSNKTVLNEVRSTELTLPDNHRSPIEVIQLGPYSSVTFNVRRKFRSPELLARLWCVGISAALVPMPETTVDKYHSLESGQHYVRFSG